MPRYVIERSFPDGFGIRSTLQGAIECRALIQLNTEAGVTWLHSYVSADEKTTFCVYEAPSPEALRRASARNGLPIGRITRVRVLDPSFAA